jgi:hypothetical protein
MENRSINFGTAPDLSRTGRATNLGTYTNLWFLTTRAGIDIGHLIDAITEKLRFREKEIDALEDRIVAKEARLKTLGNSLLGIRWKCCRRSMRSSA